jgi:copper chaperone CopZ
MNTLVPDLSIPSNILAATCPRCQHEGRTVSALTLDSLLKPEALARAADHHGFRFCASPDCPVAYYRPADGLTFAAKELRVPIFQKSAAPDRLVCYCFRHTVQKIEEQVRATGTSSVLADIKSQCAQGLDDCARNNPQGSCCLGNVRRVIKEDQARFGPRDPSAPSAGGHGEACCGASPAAAPAVRREGPSARTGAWAAGAVMTAALSSACCWLPLVLLAFGASAAGVSGFFETYRPWLLAATAVLLGAGFSFAYFCRATCAPGSVCAVPHSRGQRFNLAMLWLAAAFTFALAGFPNCAGRLLTGGDHDSQVRSAGNTLLEFRIAGMTCAACAAGLEASLRKLPGVTASEVDYARHRAWVAAAPSAAQDLKSVVQREVDAAGYRALPVPPAGNHE